MDRERKVVEHMHTVERGMEHDIAYCGWLWHGFVREGSQKRGRVPVDVQMNTASIKPGTVAEADTA